MSEFGRAQFIAGKPLGSHLTADVAAGGTVLPVEMTLDFDDDGGELAINGEVLEYVEVDPDAATVTLLEPLPADAAMYDPVEAVRGGVVTQQWTAHVALDDPDSVDVVTAEIPTYLVPFFPEGACDPPIPVLIELRQGRYVVASRPGQQPAFDAPVHVSDPSGGEQAIYPEGSTYLGNLQVASLWVPGDGLLVDGVTLAESQAAQPRGVVRRATWTPQVTGAASEYGVLGFDIPSHDDPAERIWIVTILGHARMSPAPNRFTVRLRYTSSDTDAPAAKPTITSHVHDEFPIHVAGTAMQTFSIDGLPFYPVSGRSYRMLVTLVPSSGSLDALWPIRAVITDMGINPGNTAYKNTGGGVLGTGGSDVSPDPVPETSTYWTKAFPATWSAGYNGSGSRITNGSNHAQGNGSYSSQGNTKAAIGFNNAAISRELSGAEVLDCEVFLYFNHWHWNSGGTAVVGTHGSAGNQSTWDALGTKWTDLRRVEWTTKSGGKRFSFPTDGWKSGSNKGLVLGPAPTNADKFYGKINGADQANKPWIRFRVRK